jgi:seryl-tRNA synthetase
MDLQKTIQDLYAEKDKLERVIASLEELQRAADANSHVMGRAQRRGRKSMGSEERQEVSERMKKYWAGRRNSKQQPPADSRIANGG